MKNLSKKIVAIALLLGSISFISCKKGDTGAPGVNGTNGTNGNANVTQISFGSTTKPASSSLTLTLPGITKSIADKSLILTYGLAFGQTQWMSMSGYWINFAWDKTYFTRISPSDPASSVSFDRVSGPITSETFDAIKVIVIPANVFVNGRSVNPPFDINDYESVRQYFNLPK